VTSYLLCGYPRCLSFYAFPQYIIWPCTFFKQCRKMGKYIMRLLCTSTFPADSFQFWCEVGRKSRASCITGTCCVEVGCRPRRNRICTVASIRWRTRTENYWNSNQYALLPSSAYREQTSNMKQFTVCFVLSTTQYI